MTRRPRSLSPFPAFLALQALVFLGVPALLAGQALTLEESAARVAALWSEGDADGVAAFLADGEIRVAMAGEDHPSLARRQVVATLSDLLKEAGHGTARVRQARVLGGEPPRAFVDLVWNPVTPGTSEPLVYTIFMGFTLQDAWKVSEIRVLGPG